MRLDVYLKTTRLVSRRSVAAELCRDGKVDVDGQPAKASRPVIPGDRLTLRLPGRHLTVEAVTVPSAKNIPKAEARTCYSIVDEQRFDFWGEPIEKKG